MHIMPIELTKGEAVYLSQQTIINRNDVKTMSAANYSHHRPMQDIHHADIGPPIDSVIEFGSFATRPTRRADAGQRIGTMLANASGRCWPTHRDDAVPISNN